MVRMEMDNPFRYHENLLRIAQLDQLRSESLGSDKIVIALIDGLVDQNHSAFHDTNIVSYLLDNETSYGQIGTNHATMIASMLVGKDSRLLGICPQCTLKNIAIVDRTFEQFELTPQQVARRLSLAICKAVELGAHLIQISMEFSADNNIAFNEVYESLKWASEHGVITVISAGNSAALSLNKIYSAPHVIPVGMLDKNGNPHQSSSFGKTMTMKGLLAPGEGIYGALANEQYGMVSGSSYAASFVTGALALLLSIFSGRPIQEIHYALLQRESISLTAPKKLNGNQTYFFLRKHFK